jgi:hypothetical protein
MRTAAVTLGVSYGTFKRMLHARGIAWPRHDRYSLNARTFDDADTEAKAYYLGLLTADGCVFATANSYRVILSLEATDAYLVHGFRDLLDAQHPVAIRNRKAAKPQAVVQIGSKYLGESLIRYGICPRKAMHTYIPFDLLPDNMLRHYLRGLFDGDGYFGKSACLATSSVRLVQQLQGYIHDKHAGTTKQSTRQGRYHRLYLRRNCRPFVSWMYSDSEFVMDRKLERVAADWACSEFKEQKYRIKSRYGNIN